MSEIVTLKVSDQVVNLASQIASHKQQPIEEVLSDWLESVVHERPVESLSDEEVLALSEMMLPSEQDTELSDLLARQRENELDEYGRQRLNELMRKMRRAF